jgi:hypothetical protein
MAVPTTGGSSRANSQAITPLFVSNSTGPGSTTSADDEDESQPRHRPVSARRCGGRALALTLALTLTLGWTPDIVCRYSKLDDVAMSGVAVTGR